MNNKNLAMKPHPREAKGSIKRTIFPILFKKLQLIWPLAMAALSPAVVGQTLYVGSLTGEGIYQFGLSGTRTTFAFGLDSPWGLAFDQMGNLYEANY